MVIRVEKSYEYLVVGLEEVQYGSERETKPEGYYRGRVTQSLHSSLDSADARRRRRRAERKGNMYRSTRLGDRTGAESASESGKPSPCPGDVLCTGWVTLPFLAGRHPRRHLPGLVIHDTLYILIIFCRTMP